MKIVVVLFFILINISFSFDLNNFDDRQKVLLDVKSIVLYEESIAKAYEEYILTNYAIPNLTQIKSLIGDVTTTVTGVTSTLTLDSSLTIISYGISDDVKADSSIKALYESNTFRKRTYFRNGKINFLLEDEFAKHLYDLIKQNGAIINCPNSVFTTPINCKENNHIYIQLTKKLEGIDYVPDTYLIVYHIDKFKTGPIVITNVIADHTKSEFDSIPKGALLYDIDGIKYVKTLNGIKVLK
ncbi:MAG: hypothetical protein PHY66_00645 [Aliarcobacter sp.]|nr:hypothetical protein [Aliarcobacter sp.]